MKKKLERFAISETVMSDDLKRIRSKLELTQKEFGDLCNVSRRTIEKWETNNALIKGPIVTLVRMLEDHPDFVQQMSIPVQKFPLRLSYMFNQNLCTLIDVDEKNQSVVIKNYTTSRQFRAFGANETPSFDDYTNFLEARCFPKERDMMKLALRELDLPFYDPLLIIEKTNGRMVEDDFWIKIERK